MTHDNTCSPGPSGSSPSATATSSSNRGECGPAVMLNEFVDSNNLRSLDVETEEIVDLMESYDDSSLPPFITGNPENNEISPEFFDTTFQDMLFLPDDDRPPPLIDLMVIQPSAPIKKPRKKSFPGPLTSAMIKQIPSCAIPKLPKSYFDSFYISSSDDEKLKEESADPPRRKRMFLSKADRVILAAIKSPKPSTSAVLARERESFRKRFPETPSFRQVRKDSARSREGRGIERRSLQFTSPTKKAANKKLKERGACKIRIEDKDKDKVTNKTEIKTNLKRSDVVGEPEVIGDDPPVADSKVASSDGKMITCDGIPASPKIPERKLSHDCQAAPLKRKTQKTSSSSSAKRSASPNLSPKKNKPVKMNDSSPSALHVEKAIVIPQMRNLSIRIVRLDPSTLPKKMPSPVNANMSRESEKITIVEISETSDSDSEEENLENLFLPVSASELKRVQNLKGKATDPAQSPSHPTNVASNLETCHPVLSTDKSRSPVLKLVKVPTALDGNGKQQNARYTPSPKCFKAKVTLGQTRESTATYADAGSLVNGNCKMKIEELPVKPQNLDSPKDCVTVPLKEVPTKPSQSVSTQTGKISEIEAAILFLKSVKGESGNKILTNDIQAALDALTSLKVKMDDNNSTEDDRKGSTSNGHSTSCNGNGKSLKRSNGCSPISSSELKKLMDDTSTEVMKNPKNRIILCDESSDQRRSSRAKKPRLGYY